MSTENKHAISCAEEFRGYCGNKWDADSDTHLALVALVSTACEAHSLERIGQLGSRMDVLEDTLKEQLAAKEAEIERLRSENAVAMTKLRAADAVAKAIDCAVERKVIDARSAIADARLDYGQPFTYENATAENTTLRQQVERIERLKPYTQVEHLAWCKKLLLAKACTCGLDAVLAEKGGE